MNCAEAINVPESDGDATATITPLSKAVVRAEAPGSFNEKRHFASRVKFDPGRNPANEHGRAQDATNGRRLIRP
jgi:hypothetical protein